MLTHGYRFTSHLRTLSLRILFFSPQISTTQYTQLMPEDINSKFGESKFGSWTPRVGQERIAAPTCFLITSLQNLPTRPQITVPAGPSRPGPEDRSRRFSYSCDLEDLSAPLRDLGGGGRSVARGEVAWRDLWDTRLATWFVGIHVDCQLPFPCSPRRHHVLEYLLLFCCPARGKYY